MLTQHAGAPWQLQCTRAHADAMAQRITFQQFRRYVGGGPHSSPMLAVAIAASILLWTLGLWLIVSPAFALAWCAAACIWHAAITWLHHHFGAAQPPDDQLGVWEARMRRLEVLAGCIWGSVGLLAPQAAVTHAPYLALGELLVIGPALSGTVHRPAVFWLSVPCAVLTTVSILLAGGIPNIGVGLGFALAAALLVRRACTFQELITQSMRIAEERLVLLREHEAQRFAATVDHHDRIQFLTSVSEDLDAPMRLIARLSQNPSNEPAVAQEHMRQMNTAVLEMDRLLTALLDASTKGLGRQLAPQAALPAGCTPQDAQNLRGHLVLLVDDDPLARHGMQTLLQGLGCEVLCAPSAEAALHLVEAQLRTPDLMLSDYRLGGAKTGLDAIDEVRLLIGETIPAWLISAELNVPTEQAQRRGIHVLHKPVRGEVLAAQMRQALAGIAQQQ